MEENKNLKSNTDSDELDILVSDKSKTAYELPKRTRTMPAVPTAKSTQNDMQKSTPKNDAQKPASKPTIIIPPSREVGAKIQNQSPPVKHTSEKVKKSSDDNGTKESPEKSGGIVFGLAKALIYIIGVIAVSGVLSYFGIIYANDIFAFVKEEKTAQITINENTTVSELADILYAEGMIEHPGVFKFYTWYRHRNNKNPIELNAGNYEVSSVLNYDMMLSTFKKKTGGRTIVTLTFKEGLTVDETIDIFVEAGVGNREKFIDAINNYDYDYKFVKALDNWQNTPGRKYRLEGYLYPDTYDFYTDSDESFIISKLLSNFNQKFEEEYYDRCTLLGYTVDEIINIASIIEKEGYLQEDLETISSVFHNRLNNWDANYLQSDATIQYSFEERKKEITPEDLEIDSPYNTYIHQGLPPSAIANPGLESILAALYPANTNYYFFVTRKNGAAIFSRTLGEHNDAIARVKQEKNSQSAPELSDEVLAETENVIG